MIFGEKGKVYGIKNKILDFFPAIKSGSKQKDNFFSFNKKEYRFLKDCITCANPEPKRISTFCVNQDLHGLTQSGTEKGDCLPLNQGQGKTKYNNKY